MKKIVIVLVIFLILLFLDGHFLEPNLLNVNEYSVTSSTISTSFDGFKIVQFSDILYNGTGIKNITKLVTKINEQKPDIIIFTGDLLNQNYKMNEDEISSIIEEFSKLDCTLYKYAIIGDNDNADLDTYKTILDKSGFKLLNNTYEYIFYKDLNPLKLIGVTNNDDVASLFIDEKNINPCYTIVATHQPDLTDSIITYEPNLIIGGHYLGGIIKLPFYGSLINKEGSQNYHDSYYKLNNTDAYFSNGIGNEGFAFRIFNTPSINLYRLKKN